MSMLGFSNTSDFTCGFFRELDDRGSYSYADLAQLCATAPTGPLTGVWMSRHTMPLTEFPRLFPVVVIDDGTDVFVRSLPGTLRHLTMKLTFTYDLELSGSIGIHHPGELPSWDRGKVFHEYIRFRASGRHFERLKCLRGEWQRRDLLGFETRVRPSAGERSGREWWLHRCTTSLDQATLDQYVDVPPAPEPTENAAPVCLKRAAAAPDPVMPLNEALSYLLHPDAGVAWHAAATQAARLLAPFWHEVEDDEHAQDQLACLALVVYTLADESLTAPSMVPIEEIRKTLRQGGEQAEHPAPSEPQELTLRMLDALTMTGHGAARTEGASGRAAIPPVYQLYMSRTTEDWHVRQNRPYLPTGPSDLARLLPWLARRLSRLDPAELGPAPKPAGLLTVHVSGKVWTPPSIGTVDTRTVIACPDCGSVRGATVIVDRTRVTLVCANRHRSDPKQLSAPTVRLALRETAGLRGTSVETASSVMVTGDFKVRHRGAYDLKLAEQPTNHPAD